MQAYSGWFRAAVLISAMTATVFAQSTTPTKPKRARTAASASQQDVKDLRELVSAQQQQLEAQRRQMDAIKAQLQQVLEATQQANAAAIAIGARSTILKETFSADSYVPGKAEPAQDVLQRADFFILFLALAIHDGERCFGFHGIG